MVHIWIQCFPLEWKQTRWSVLYNFSVFPLNGSRPYMFQECPLKLVGTSHIIKHGWDSRVP